ncbi:nucleotide sugar dehydrogenase [Tenacibaculum finnmarkense]|uniref:nucleotide sugar dehydrogenase n=1 Tax=Tenacibaculum finnmarkense TaxID=2781243 RepID=UPI001E58CB88|nr:nucleotide sugar dehydrogenase [Tenacibaculum finnmarkense]MCD8410907.1 nucleotide sugar dehydrogenase [Tenacibaculum finnmarkense genomovar ulcerans]MCD8423120.1 nucleotide sugar dehydrogenase [Tenacibaculum finnmarkense genomovar ulcerans]MCD8443588.1 nucleotide sugar dehydrogenase [Tenacibaculum finnmarkense genomovar ulcerans]MCG8239335.1 nucleotide sugar dehydrogenase [Tenacibaculum finnmarkense genomovar ulcerans]MCG8796163.1 nucleotide sugar dehydrogenase [Tenacibaculum finnmarkense]
MNKEICIVGLGYVGLPLAHAFAAKKFKVVGFDINNERVNELKEGYDRTLEIEKNQLEDVKDTIKYTSEVSDISAATIFIVTVPTPIDSSNRPDLTPLIKSSQLVGTVLKKGDIVIYESTVYPGVTEEICVPELEKTSTLKFNKDFFCGYSPERINPGDKEHTVTKILKVTSGSTPEIATEVDELYKSIIIAGTHKASSIKVAEASKVIENTQRDVNIALINELALIFDTMNIDTNEVLEAAATKWNFIKLSPGLVGGHCIGVDPYYLTYKAEELGYKPNLILGARQINNGMGKYIAENTVKIMIANDQKINKSNVLVLGVTFKEDCPDMRNTKVVDIIDELKKYGCNVDVYDPWVDPKGDYSSYKHGVIENPFEATKKYDSIVVAVAHQQFKELTRADYERISKDVPVIMDIKGIVDNPNWRL